MIPDRVAQAQLFDGPGRPFRLERIRLPSRLQSGEILVAVELASICGSDLHTIGGARPAPTPLVLGHEAVGTVVEVGPDRSDLSSGDRITWTIAASCGRCSPCRLYHLPQKCEELFNYGHAAAADGSGLNGCFASHLLLRPGTHFAVADESLAGEVLVAANCALATAVNATEALPVPCQSALVQGAGLVGIYTCGLLRQKGVKTVYVADVSDKRLRLVESFGGIPLEGDAVPIRDRMGWADSDGVDAAFEMTGDSAVVPEGVAALRAGGHYVFVGMVHPHTPLDITGDQVIRKCLTLRGIHNYAPHHLDGGIAFLRSNSTRYPFSELVSEPVPLQDLDRAVERARARDFYRVAVRPDR